MDKIEHHHDGIRTVLEESPIGKGWCFEVSAPGPDDEEAIPEHAVGMTDSKERAQRIIQTLVTIFRDEATTDCTCIGSRWCAIHGDCICPEEYPNMGDHVAEPDPKCPLHGEEHG